MQPPTLLPNSMWIQIFLSPNRLWSVFPHPSDQQLLSPSIPRHEVLLPHSNKLRNTKLSTSLSSKVFPHSNKPEIRLRFYLILTSQKCWRHPTYSCPHLHQPTPLTDGFKWRVGSIIGNRYKKKSLRNME